MLITESQVKAIIKEEIQKMIEEGEMEESWLSDVGRSAAQGLAGRAAKLAGLTSTGLAAQEKAAAEKKAAGEEKALLAKKAKAQQQVFKKAKEMEAELLKLETEKLNQLADAAELLRYDTGEAMSIDPLVNSFNAAQRALKNIMMDVSGRYIKDAGSGHYDMTKTLREDSEE